MSIKYKQSLCCSLLLDLVIIIVISRGFKLTLVSLTFSLNVGAIDYWNVSLSHVKDI